MGGTWASAVGAGVLVSVAACFSPAPAPGLPCTAELGCPAGQDCDVNAPAGPTCVPAGQVGVDAPGAEPDAPVDAPPGTPDAPASPDAPPGSPDAPPAVPDAPPVGIVNDLPAGAIDISAGGTFTFDPSGAFHDFTATCTGPGGRDVYYTLTLPGPEVVYLDTFGSDYDTVIVVKNGPCTGSGSNVACVDDTCNGPDAQGAWSLATGTYCVIVDAGSAGATGAIGSLTVLRTGHVGPPLVGTAGAVTGNTCGASDDNSPSCGCGPAEDDHWFFLVCPNQTFTADADTCTNPQFDNVLQIRRGSGMSLTCEDSDQCAQNTENVSAAISQPGLYWIIVDGCDECGPYTLTYNF